MDESPQRGAPPAVTIQVGPLEEPQALPLAEPIRTGAEKIRASFQANAALDEHEPIRNQLTHIVSGDIDYLLLEDPVYYPNSQLRTVDEFRTGFRRELLACIDEIVATQILQKICDVEPSGDLDRRKESLKKTLRKCLDESFTLFWVTLESLARTGIAFDHRDPIDFLQRNEDLALAFIEVVREHPENEAIMDQIQAKCAERKRERPPVNYFRGSSVSGAPSLFTEFGHHCDEEEHRTLSFELIMERFNAFCAQLSGARQFGFPVPGTTEAWDKFMKTLIVNIYGKDHRTPRTFTIANNYGALLELSDYIEIAEGDPSEENPATGNLVISDNLRAAIQSAGPDIVPTVLVPSITRDARQIDVDRVQREIGQIPDLIFTIDSAQDKYAHPDADVVFYSKLYGGSGQGLVSMSRDLDPKIHRAFAVKSGLSLEQIARTVAILWCQQRPDHFSNRFQELLDTENIWRFSGKGQYLTKKAKQVRKFVEESSVLSQHFTVEFPEDEGNEATPNPWRSTRMIMFHKRPDSPIDISKVPGLMHDDHGWCQVDCIAPLKSPELQEIMELGEGDFLSSRVGPYLEALLEYQTITHPKATTELLILPEIYNQIDRIISGETTIDQDLFERQKAHLQECAQRQEGIRISINVQMISEDIERLLHLMESAADHEYCYPDADA